MNEPSRHCINCKHFTRDFNRYFDHDCFEVSKTGHCTVNPPTGTDLHRLDKEKLSADKQLVALLYVPPVVHEDFVCGKFEPKEKTQSEAKATLPPSSVVEIE